MGPEVRPQIIQFGVRTGVCGLRPECIGVSTHQHCLRLHGTSTQGTLGSDDRLAHHLRLAAVEQHGTRTAASRMCHSRTYRFT